MTEGTSHRIVNVSHRGILGGWTYWCSCGASIIEPEGDRERVDAHLAGPPNQRQPSMRDRLRSAVRDANVASARLQAVLEICDELDQANRYRDQIKYVTRPEQRAYDIERIRKAATGETE